MQPYSVQSAAFAYHKGEPDGTKIITTQYLKNKVLFTETKSHPIHDVSRRPHTNLD